MKPMFSNSISIMLTAVIVITIPLWTIRTIHCFTFNMKMLNDAGIKMEMLMMKIKCNGLTEN